MPSEPISPTTNAATAAVWIAHLYQTLRYDGGRTVLHALEIATILAWKKYENPLKVKGVRKLNPREKWETATVGAIEVRIPSIDLTVALQGAISRRFTAPLALQFAVCDVRASSLCLCLVADAATDVASAFASNVV